MCGVVGLLFFFFLFRVAVSFSFTLKEMNHFVLVFFTGNRTEQSLEKIC